MPPHCGQNRAVEAICFAQVRQFIRFAIVLTPAPGGAFWRAPRKPGPALDYSTRRARLSQAFIFPPKNKEPPIDIPTPFGVEHSEYGSINGNEAKSHRVKGRARVAKACNRCPISRDFDSHPAGLAPDWHRSALHPLQRPRCPLQPQRPRSLDRATHGRPRRLTAVCRSWERQGKPGLLSCKSPS